MHIVYLCGEYPPNRGGGVGTFTRTIARGLVEEGHQVTVFGFSRQPIETIENDRGVNVVRLPAVYLPVVNPFINGFTLQKRIKAHFRSQKIDIIEGQEMSLIGLSDHSCGVRIIRMHGGHHFFSETLGQKPALGRRWLERLSFHHADHLCAVSKFVADKTRALLKLGARPIELLYNSVDTKRFKPLSLDLEQENLIFFAGTICEKKGIRQLVMAMPEILNEVPNARLLVAGRDSRDPKTGEFYTERLISIVSPQIANRISFLGPVANDKMPDWIGQAAVCVYPSLMESLGIVSLEGMACGKAVVASETGPGPELIDDGVDGLLCDPYDPHSIADKVITLLKNSELRENLGRSARKTVETKFSLDVMITKNIDFYRRCSQDLK